jgi:hypothetical protein
MSGGSRAFERASRSFQRFASVKPGPLAVSHQPECDLLPLSTLKPFSESRCCVPNMSDALAAKSASRAFVQCVGRERCSLQAKQSANTVLWGHLIGAGLRCQSVRSFLVGRSIPNHRQHVRGVEGRVRDAGPEADRRSSYPPCGTEDHRACPTWRAWRCYAPNNGTERVQVRVAGCFRMSFDYGASAELFLAKPAKLCRTKYRRFTTSAEALHFAVEDLRTPKPSACGCRWAMSASTAATSSACTKPKTIRYGSVGEPLSLSHCATTIKQAAATGARAAD